MKAVILGAGIIGLSTANALVKRGYEVTIIEQNSEVGHGTTFANGAQLSYSYVAPLAGPGVMGKVPKWLLDPNSPLRFKPSLDPAMVCWNLKFLKACNSTTSAKTTQELLKLAYLSRDCYHKLFAEDTFSGIDYSCTGKLVVHRSEESMQSAVCQLDVQAKLGGQPQQALSRQQCIEKEPALAPIADQLVGGIFTESEEAADAYKVSLAFKEYLLSQGVKILFNHKVKQLEKINASQVQIRLQDGNSITADKIIVCLGVESTSLLRQIDVSVPVAPLKGYSLTLPIENDQMAPKVSITDFERKVVYARLGNRLRLAGMADLVGLDYKIDPVRIKALINEAKAVFAAAGDYDKATQWAGLRPATPLGKPIIDTTPFNNLFINVGHGALGFTLATGSAEILAELVDGKSHPLQALFSLSAS
ncbi:D-amino acid dehydrogenase [Pelistega indica]|uniref:D-amino acid dehydrogenase n=1 Tax=Pelistega indica TaxID=1414851 RepID=V8G9D9_9BURK|nr:MULTISPECIES: D-amino acid dehydrogenase [Pelistega]ETD72548.1 D-amino acid dehydrogenase [Pelistega indica]